jgi:hypothetical protein
MHRPHNKCPSIHNSSCDTLCTTAVCSMHSTLPPGKQLPRHSDSNNPSTQQDELRLAACVTPQATPRRSYSMARVATVHRPYTQPS